MLVICFLYDEAEIIDLYFNERNGNMKKQLDIWRSRNTSLKGKNNNIENTYIASNLISLSFNLCTKKCA